MVRIWAFQAYDGSSILPTPNIFFFKTSDLIYYKRERIVQLLKKIVIVIAVLAAIALAVAVALTPADDGDRDSPLFI